MPVLILIEMKEVFSGTSGPRGFEANERDELRMSSLRWTSRATRQIRRFTHSLAHLLSHTRLLLGLIMTLKKVMV